METDVLDYRMSRIVDLPYKEALEHFRHSSSPDRSVMINMALAAVTCIVTRRVLPRLLPDMPRDVLDDLARHTWRSFTSTLWEGVYRHDLAEDAARLPPEFPVLLLHGDRDATAPLSGIQRVMAGRPRWTLLVLPGADHHPLLRDQAWCVNAIQAAAAG